MSEQTDGWRIILARQAEKMLRHLSRAALQQLDRAILAWPSILARLRPGSFWVRIYIACLSVNGVSFTQSRMSAGAY